MSANHSLTLLLTLTCLVRTVAASDLVYVAAEQAVVPANSQPENQLVLVQQANYQTTPATAPASTPSTPASAKKLLTSKFFRFGRKQEPTVEANKSAASDNTVLRQPQRIAATSKPSHGDAVLTNPRAEVVRPLPAPEEVVVADSSNSFMTRLRQLSSADDGQKSKSPDTAQVAVHKEAQDSIAQDSTNVEDLVYVEEPLPQTSEGTSKKKSDILLTQVYSEQLEHALSALPAVDSIEVTADEPAEAPTGFPIPEPAKIVFRPAVVDVNSNGQPVLRPDVYLAGQVTPPPPPGPAQEELPVTAEPVVPEEWSVPIVDGAYEQYMSHAAPRLGPIQELCCRVGARLHGPVGCEPGLGTERVMHAISFVDTSQPMQNLRFRVDAGYDYQSPDRAEYFWAKINGRGPLVGAGVAAPRVDYQDFRTYMEVGGDKFSVGTDVPIRVLDPDEPFFNTSGIGDVNITTKTLFLDGKFWQLTNLFRTYIPAGDPSKGLGTGHASIEPGFAIRYKYSDYTYFHGDLKYWIPLGGDPEHEGEVLNYGIAMSHVWRETDSTAIMPTIELKAYSFLDGLETNITGAPEAAPDPEGILIIHPGIRWAWDHGTDCGLREVGLFSGISLTRDDLYEELIRLEFRWNW